LNFNYIPTHKNYFSYAKKCGKIYHKLIDNLVYSIFSPTNSVGSIVVVITAFRVEGVSLSTRYPVYYK